VCGLFCDERRLNGRDGLRVFVALSVLLSVTLGCCFYASTYVEIAPAMRWLWFEMAWLNMDGMMDTGRLGWIQAAKEGKYFEIAGLSVTLKVASTDSHGGCAVLEMTVPPFFKGCKPHFHQQTTEVLYVICGALAFTLGEETVIARQGSVIHIMPGVVHRLWNPTVEPATYLTVCLPGGIEQYLEALADLLSETETSSSPIQRAQVIALGLEYDHFFAEGQ